MPRKGSILTPRVGFIWDIDGVVVDSPHEEAWRITAMKEPWNIEGLSSDFYFNHVASRPRYAGGDNILELKGVYQRLGAVTAKEKYALLERFCTEKNSLIEQLIETDKFNLFADAVTLLLKAKSIGIKQAAASASKNARRMLSHVTSSRLAKEVGDTFGVLGENDTLLSLFDVDACGLDISNKKDILKTAAEQLNTLPGTDIERFVVFEDAPSGVEAAKSLGYHAVGILRIGSENVLCQAGADIVTLQPTMAQIEELLQ